MQDQELKPQPQNSYWVQILITEIVCIAIILCTVIVTKYFYKNTYKDIKVWFEENICNDTDINEVIIPDGDFDEV